ncbi:Hsp20/alpha crystallin family protein [Patescibacteria group bacterium]|nr:Hsp20/alpha crystallin family protein [Patescibacteria group bacterium]
MPIIKWAPLWDPFEESDKLFEGMPSLRQVSGFVPSVDIYEDKDNVIVETPLVNIKPEDVEISIENDVLTIEGKAEKRSEVDEKNYYRKEVRYGSFHRSVALPKAVKSDGAKAAYEDGMLKITVPKEERVKAKAVKVEIKKKKSKK